MTGSVCMGDVFLRPYEVFCCAEIEDLYRSVGWTSYLRRPGLLKEAFEHSLCTLAAYSGNRLIGIVRAVGDGVSILYIQDLLIHPDYQHRGIGSRLLNEMLRLYPDVNQTVLLTDDTPETVGFYESAGFRKVQAAGCCSFIRLNDWYQ